MGAAESSLKDASLDVSVACAELVDSLRGQAPNCASELHQRSCLADVSLRTTAEREKGWRTTGLASLRDGKLRVRAPPTPDAALLAHLRAGAARFCVRPRRHLQDAGRVRQQAERASTRHGAAVRAAASHSVEQLPVQASGRASRAGAGQHASRAAAGREPTLGAARAGARPPDAAGEGQLCSLQARWPAA
jgi:hypothetical protein